MRIVNAAFDLSAVPHAVGGVSRYTLSLARALMERSVHHGIEMILVDVPAAHPGVNVPDLECTLLPDPFYCGIPILRRIPRRMGLESKTRGRRLAKCLGVPGIYHHSGVQPYVPDGSLSVITVYDLSALINPDWHTSSTVDFVRLEMELIKSGSFVAAISDWTADELEDQLGGMEDRIQVIGGAADDRFDPGPPSERILQSYGLEPDGYLLHVGNFVPRKNIPFLIEVYQECRMSGLELTLVLVGEGSWGGMTVESGEGIIVLDRVPDDHMPDLYRGARALLFPSTYEGLGLPALEALACETPVLASMAGALPQTVGSCGMLLPTSDAAAWKEGIMQLMDAASVQELRGMAGLAPRRRWDSVADELCGFYRRIIGE